MNRSTSVPGVVLRWTTRTPPLERGAATVRRAPAAESRSVPVVGDGDGRPGVVTPDAVAIDLPVATVGTRGVAFMVDLAIVVAAILLLNLASDVFGSQGWVDGWFGIAVVLLLVFAIQFGYTTTFETLWRGRTPGKAVMGLRVLTNEGAPVGFRHAALRTVTAPIELTASLGAIAVVTALVSPRQQRLGDLLAGTTVVRERRVAGAPTAQRFDAPPGLEGYVATLDVSAVGPREYATVRDVLRRLPSLPADAARRVSEQVATALAGRVQPPPPDGIDAVRYLACIAAAVQRRSGGPAVPATDTWGAVASSRSGQATAPRTGPPAEAPGAPPAEAGPPRAPSPSDRRDERGGFAPPA
ncbi:RDD family protein [Nitriliruptoraceae bacterium ZYF776]|nr:RDD family protein [Profundirhabdus halotolerans]